MLNSGVASYSSINAAAVHVWPPAMRKCCVPHFSLACLEHSNVGGPQSFDRDEAPSLPCNLTPEHQQCSYRIVHHHLILLWIFDALDTVGSDCVSRC